MADEMTNQKKAPTGTVWIVLAAIGYVWAFGALIRAVIVETGAGLAGGLVGVLILAGIATLLLVTGLKARKRRNA